MTPLSLHYRSNRWIISDRNTCRPQRRRCISVVAARQYINEYIAGPSRTVALATRYLSL